jgi:hypothetical protein
MIAPGAAMHKHTLAGRALDQTKATSHAKPVDNRAPTRLYYPQAVGHAARLSTEHSFMRGIDLLRGLARRVDDFGRIGVS